MPELIILASGASSRFWPLAQDRHKTLYPIYLGRSVFYYTLHNLNAGGWKRAIVTARTRDIERMEKEVPEGMEVIFVSQDEPKGQGDAILRAAARIGEETFYLTSADKICGFWLLNKLRAYGERGGLRDVFVATAPTSAPSLYGVIRHDKRGRITEVVEKPARWNDPRPRKIVSAYRLNRMFLRMLLKTPQGEYSFEAALQRYAAQYQAWSVPVDEVPGTTLKYPWHLLSLNRWLTQNLTHSFMSERSRVEQGAIIVPPAHIEKDVRVSGSAVIRGPVVIREGAVIGDHALVRDFSYIGKGALIGAGSEVKNSIICDGAKLHDAHALDSIIGEGCNLGAGTRISNTRFDCEPVTSVVKGKKVSTDTRHFGVIMGKNSRTATLANLMPGVKIGNDCWIGGSFAITRDIPDGHIAYMDENGKVIIKPRKM